MNTLPTITLSIHLYRDPRHPLGVLPPCHAAQGALNFADLDVLREQGDEEARALQVTIFVHCKRQFNGVDVSTAPKWPATNLDRWCRCTVAAKNPVPVWLRTGSQPRCSWLWPRAWCAGPPATWSSPAGSPCCDFDEALHGSIEEAP